MRVALVLAVGLCLGAAPGVALADETERAFMSAAGFTHLEPAALEAKLAGAAGVDLGPVDKAVALLDALEKALPRVRYRVTLGHKPVPQDNGATTLVAFVEIHRFNLGPAIRRDAVSSYGAENVAPATGFGVGPHVAMRLTFSGMRGALAVIREAARMPVPERAARSLRCLTVSCLALDSAGDRPDWQDKDWASPPPFAKPREDGTIGSTDIARQALAGIDLWDERGTWREPETPESVPFGQPFITLVIDRDLGQDSGVSGIVRYAELMDDSIAELWARVDVMGGAAHTRFINVPRKRR